MKKWMVKIFAVMAIVAVMVGIHPDIDAYAKKCHTILVGTDCMGHTFIEQDGKQMRGYFKIGSKTYYGHKTKSYAYPKGSICKNEYRVRNGKLYYFDDNGVMVRKNTRKLPMTKFNKNGSVHYIYMKNYRYNANHKRYQYRNKDGKWVDVGMQCYPQGIIDWQM